MEEHKPEEKAVYHKKLKEFHKKGAERSKLKKKLGEKCTYCGCDNPLILTVDHIVPKARGGSDDDSNKQVLCHVCNYLKGALKEKEFRAYMKSLKILQDLCKVRLVFPKDLMLEFRPAYFPSANDKPIEEVPKTYPGYEVKK